MGDQEIFDLVKINPTSLDIGPKAVLRSSTTRIHQSHMTAKINQIKGGVCGRSELIATYLEDFSGYLDRFSLFIIHKIKIPCFWAWLKLFEKSNMAGLSETG